MIQTLSKSRSLAGLRVGFAIGHKDLITGLERVKNSFNSYTLDRLALAGAKAAFEDIDYFNETREQIIATRERVKMELESYLFLVLIQKQTFYLLNMTRFMRKKFFRSLKKKEFMSAILTSQELNNIYG